ncbi:hypothetical protein NPIL_329781 [Nephila pilipes]|uniref:C2H2-type domain-containing protein n=1 Tax=Nephila pilipes TaxID=299642 RepID=A0A8X6PHA7_NEPPI|nr:hypothetical protein NPIL_329781 [Nephila pilipes]
MFSKDSMRAAEMNSKRISMRYVNELSQSNVHEKLGDDSTVGQCIGTASSSGFGIDSRNSDHNVENLDFQFKELTFSDTKSQNDMNGKNKSGKIFAKSKQFKRSSRFPVIHFDPISITRGVRPAGKPFQCPDCKGIFYDKMSRVYHWDTCKKALPQVAII